MSFNVDELSKIKSATSGWFKGSARRDIATALSNLSSLVKQAKRMPPEGRAAALKELVNNATAARHQALENGASSYGHAEWAAASVCETWLHALAGGDEDLERVEQLVEELRSRK